MIKGKELKGKELARLKKKLKNTKPENIIFHKDFSKGERIAVCLTCGYSQNFFGLWDYDCDNCGGKMKTYSAHKFQDFIFRLQRIAKYRTAEIKKAELEKIFKLLEQTTLNKHTIKLLKKSLTKKDKE